MNTYEQELSNILKYWTTVAFDPERDRFYGRVDEYDQPDTTAPLGSVMYSRILWAYSAAYLHNPSPTYYVMAKKALTYLTTALWDNTYGGVYWSVTANDKPLEDKKQTYALAFAIYGLSEYYRVVADENVLARAKELYELIELHNYDCVNGGYLESFNRDWSVAADLRLSAKDANEKKTMNTHLHVMEAYVNLYQVWPDPTLATRIAELINLFATAILNPKDNHLTLFFNEIWEAKSAIVSYGHDIEASWLLCEAANVLQDPALIKLTTTVATKLIESSLEGLNHSGALDYEFEISLQKRNTEKHWWVQAEAAVGLLNAWQITGNPRYYELFEKSWRFISENLIDNVNGEWFWGLNSDGSKMAGQDKAGIWKCPYHNTRCLLEISKRLPSDNN